MVDEEDMPEEFDEENEEEEEEEEDYEEEDFEDEENEKGQTEDLFGFDDIFLHRITVDILRLAFEAHKISLLEGSSSATKTIMAQLIPLLTAFKGICRAYGIEDEISATINADDKELEQLITKVISAIYKLKEYGA